MDWMYIFTIAHSLWVIWLMGVFFVIAWWAYNPKNKKRFEEDAMIPFRNDDRNGGGFHG